MDLRDVPEPATADGDLHCASLNIAARLLALAQPGGICLSQTAYEQVRNKLDLNFRPLGAYRVKNSGEPIRFYAVDPAMPAAAPLGIPARRRRWLIAAALGLGLVLAAVAAWLGWQGMLPRLPGLAGITKTASVASLAHDQADAVRGAAIARPIAWTRTGAWSASSRKSSAANSGRTGIS